VLAAADFFTVEVWAVLSIYSAEPDSREEQPDLSRDDPFWAHYEIDNQLIEPFDRAESSSLAVKCTQRLGGMLRFYHRAAA